MMEKLVFQLRKLYVYVQHTSKPSHQKPVQKAEDFEKKLSNFLKYSEAEINFNQR